MLTVTLAQLKSDIAGKMKGTSIREVSDFYGTVTGAANRMLSRIDTEETRRTATLSTPFWDNINDYTLPTDFKAMIDVRPTAGRNTQPGNSHYEGTSIRQFRENLTPDSFAIQWNNAIRTLKAQVLPSGNVTILDAFTSSSANGQWAGEGDVAVSWDQAVMWDQGFNWDAGLYTEPLNFVQGNASMGFNLSGVTGAADLVNTTASPTDLSEFNYQDASMVFFYIPLGFSSRFTSFTLRRGSSASNYVQVTVSTKADGTAFTDGWNLLVFSWNTGSVTGSPDDTQNTYRYFGVNYTVGTYIKGCLLDSWTDSLGQLYEIEYYSECLFRTSAGVWEYTPTSDNDLINVGPAAYEILKLEVMNDITRQIRTGAMLVNELAEWHKMLNGDPESRYVKNPPFHGAYWDYINQFPSSRIVIATRTYTFDV